MMKGFKIRLFPTEEQAVKLWQAIDTSRWVWNWGIAYNNDLYSRERKYLLHQYSFMNTLSGLTWV